jgi:O-antigen/teichoic acid export membrane protein
MGSILSFLGTVYFARELGSSLFGTFVLFQALSQMLAVPADFGLQGAVIKRMSERDNQSEVLSTAILMLGGSLTIVCICVYSLKNTVNNYLGAQLVVFLITVILLNELSKLAQNVLKGELRVGEIASLNFVKQLTFNGLGAILLFTGAEVLGLIYALLASFTVVLLWGVYKWDTSLGKPSLRTVKSLFNFSKFSVVSYVDSYLYNWLDVAVIGLLLTQSEVGAYEVAWRVSAIVMLFSGAIETTILPQISEWDSDGSRKQIEQVLPHAITASLFFVVPAFFGVIVLSRDLLYYVFTPEYASAWLILIILLGGKLFEGADRIFKNVLSGMDRPDLRAVAVLVSIFLNIILNFILVRWIGSIGAAIATTVSFAVSTVIIVYYLSKLITIEPPYREILSCFVSASIMASILFILRQKTGIRSLSVVISFVLLGGVLYITTVLAFPTIRGHIRDTLRTVIN